MSDHPTFAGHPSDPLTTRPEMAESPGGLIAPKHLLDGPPAMGGRDKDGRRRIVLSRDERRRLVGLAKLFKVSDLGIVITCQPRRLVNKVVEVEGAKVLQPVWEPISGACGELMVREGEGTDDPGYGCKCTRIHFLGRNVADY